MQGNLKNKNVLLGITGGIAAFKAATLASALMKQGANVNVVMTQNALEFISPLTFETLCNTPCLHDTFERYHNNRVSHLNLAQNADIAIIAPCTANVIGKLAHGIADDLLTTTFLACKCPKLIAPAMNTDMYEAPVVQDNLQTLQNYGYEIIEPIEGLLACKTVGKGKMAEPEDLLQRILLKAARKHTLKGRKVLVTAGATREFIDPARYLSNPSTGKMGIALAWEAALRGAETTLIAVNIHISIPPQIRILQASDAQTMYDIAMQEGPNHDDIIMTAAVADYTPTLKSPSKLKKGADTIEIACHRTKDILKDLGLNKRPNQKLIGFALESEDLIDNAKKKWHSKNLDLIVANPLNVEGAGFASDTNMASIIRADGVEELNFMPKTELAAIIWDRIENIPDKK